MAILLHSIISKKNSNCDLHWGRHWRFKCGPTISKVEKIHETIVHNKMRAIHIKNT